MPRGIAHGAPFRKFGGPEKRLKLLSLLVRALIENERIEVSFSKALETQKYANRLIEVARHGKQNSYTNDMMDFWLDGNEELKNKVFNVLLPRYEDTHKSFTRVAPLPSWYNETKDRSVRMAVIEYIGNPLPPLPVKQENPNTLQNILINSAKESWFQHKF